MSDTKTTATLFDAYLGGQDVAACFGAVAFTAHMLAFETALAEAEAELGFVPDGAARAILAAAEVDRFDLDDLARATVAASNPAIPLVQALTAAVAADDKAAARYVHWGATSQDVVDSATMLAARTALEIIDARLARIGALLIELAAAHRATPMVARTLSQQAGPTTFGFKCAGWLDGLVGARTAIHRECLALPLQFGGATGTLAAFGERGRAVAALVAARLDLRDAAPWHTERGAVRALAAALAQVAAAAGKIADDIVRLAQSEVGEVAERAEDGRGGSSALPHKRNPVAAIAACAAARRAPGCLATVFAAFDQQHERAAGAWHAEWPALVGLFTVTGGALEQLERALDGLEIDAAAMLDNLERMQGLGMSEAVAMALAPTIGRAAAQAVVRQACLAAVDAGENLATVLGRDAQVVEILGSDGLAAALAPENHLGVAGELVDAAIARARAWHATPGATDAGADDAEGEVT
ncbi:MAG: 3-carboxy-cis,cis-muconate cycloisomerase [Gammaproteobacteria bacterium]|nr:3-carboxy-cis,cis-muconate cycloisomerase [Gammaproteobacteria bacterium]